MMSGCKCRARLSVCSFAIALGVVSGLCMMLFAWYGLYYNQGVTIITQWGEIYSGYEATMRGGLIGGAWGFLEGFIVGLVLAGVYNLCLCCCKKSSCKCCESSNDTVR